MNWLADHFRSVYLLTPFASRNVVYGRGTGAFVGFTDYFIFGIRIARVQRTQPWE